MAAKKLNTVQIVRQIVLPFADEMGLSIWDIQFVKEGAAWVLRIFIDKENGVSINDCADFSRAINKPLDLADPISQSYCLEVSSPGVERELVRDEHFEWAVGKAVMVKTIRPLDGVRDFCGTLLSYEGNVLKLELSDKTVLDFNKKEISVAKLDDFDVSDFDKQID